MPEVSLRRCQPLFADLQAMMKSPGGRAGNLVGLLRSLYRYCAATSAFRYSGGSTSAASSGTAAPGDACITGPPSEAVDETVAGRPRQLLSGVHRSPAAAGRQPTVRRFRRPNSTGPGTVSAGSAFAGWSEPRPRPAALVEVGCPATLRACRAQFRACRRTASIVGSRGWEETDSEIVSLLAAPADDGDPAVSADHF